MSPVEAAVRKMQAGIQEDIYLQGIVTFEESFNGTSRDVEFDRIVKCDPCSGHGRNCTSGVACPGCGGTGVNKLVQGNFIFSHTCQQCGGRDNRTFELCPRCGGRGGTTEHVSLKLNIPAGINDKAAIRVPGYGNWVPVEEAHGDCVAVVRVAPHPHLWRAGNDIRLTHEVDYKDLILGATCVLDILGQECHVEILPMTRSGEDAVLIGAGFPGGDLRVTVEASRDIPIEELATLREIRCRQVK